MYLHLGQDTVITTETVIGIFDMDECTVSKKTRDYLTAAEKRGRVVNVSFELPGRKTSNGQSARSMQ